MIKNFIGTLIMSIGLRVAYAGMCLIDDPAVQDALISVFEDSGVTFDWSAK